MRFHVLGLPHTVTSKDYVACAFTQKAYKFGKMMKALGHTVIHYGHEDSDLECDEHVTCTTNYDLVKAYGNHDWRKTFFKYNVADHAYMTFYKNAIHEVGKRKQKDDFLLAFWGHGVRPVCEAHKEDMIIVEPGIGYGSGHWAPYKVFESYAIYHAYYGLKATTSNIQDWRDVVIPNYFDPDDFKYNAKKEDYFLYLGRIHAGKGVNAAIKATELAGVKLVIAGQIAPDFVVPPHVEHVGYADTEKRKKLMSNARASFLPSLYLEPFGGVQIENLLSGTPTITTDWGAFAENNIQGVTGFRCRTMADFVESIHRIDEIKPKNCRIYGENFTLERVGKMYERYFTDILNIRNDKGFFTEKPTGLDWLNKTYPKV